MNITHAGFSPLIDINVPDWFEQADFVAWLEGEQPVMSWHRHGKVPDENADTVVFVESNLEGEGSEMSAMPEKYWQQIIQACRQHFSADASCKHQIVVRLTNFPE